MKKCFLFLLCSFIMSVADAQFSRTSYDSEDFESFLKTTTYVMKTGDADKDAELDSLLAKYWKVTPYRLVPESEFYAKQKDPKASLMMPGYFSSGTLVNDLVYFYSGFIVVTGGIETIRVTDMFTKLTSTVLKIQDKHIVAYSPLNHYYTYKGKTYTSPFYTSARGYYKYGYDGFENEWFKMAAVIKGMNKAIELVRDNQLSKPSMEKMCKEFYNKGLAALKTKTLYVSTEDMQKDISIEKIRKAYPYKVELVSKEDLIKIAASGRTDALYLTLPHSYGSGIIIIDPSTNECVGGVQMKDFTTIDTGDLKGLYKLTEKLE